MKQDRWLPGDPRFGEADRLVSGGPDDFGGEASATVHPSQLVHKPRYLANAEYDLPGRALRHYTIGSFSTEQRGRLAGEAFVKRLRSGDETKTEPYMSREWLHSGSRDPDDYIENRSARR